MADNKLLHKRVCRDFEYFRGLKFLTKVLDNRLAKNLGRNRLRYKPCRISALCLVCPLPRSGLFIEPKTPGEIRACLAQFSAGLRVRQFLILTKPIRDMAPKTLGYWDIRGLAQPIRLLLAYTGTDFEDKRYKAGPAPDHDRSSWLDEKFNLGLALPNLPYYIEGDVKITQTGAILRYIGRKYNLMGQTEEEKIRMDTALYEFRDMRMNWARLCYNPQFHELKAAYLEDIPKKFKEISDFLGSRKWFAGENITIADFVAYEELEVHLHLDPTSFDKFPNLQQYLKRFEALENVAAYKKSDKFLAKPINFCTATFNP